MRVGGAPRLVIDVLLLFEFTPNMSNAFVSIRCDARASRTLKEKKQTFFKFKFM